MPYREATTWILIADGARAQIIANEGPGKGLKPLPGRAYQGANLPTREIVSDKPGRTYDRGGTGGWTATGRHAMEPRTDWHRFEKERFARAMAKVLDKASGANAFDRLVLVAPPQTLGELRIALKKRTRARITAELAKDLTNVPIHDLPGHLDGVVAL
ncbi:MAG: host attachment protein [Alphaproteobacteria bacterium]|jgi:protein required for attachment to host cells|nr:host attachment protein [Pseudomonadota bacterium]MCH7635250.1 host attachment protein [Pseudomonadota bacterium]MCH8139476.1 host attachment protein [Pseudomonadota bacterium]MCZ6483549.1 host attachment protein [Alphaproteobacteria bacterium]MCZ6743536.1 host attachment protein [Alphaproteobacteria bacterium]